jgi:hypothetical protein
MDTAAAFGFDVAFQTVGSVEIEALADFKCIFVIHSFI